MLDYEKYVDEELLKRLTPEQAKLAQLMSDISEECYCAGWMTGNEFRLWSALTDPADDRRYGMDVITDEWLDHLHKLSTAAGGWIRWDDSVGEVFVPMDEWLRIYAAPELHSESR